MPCPPTWEYSVQSKVASNLAGPELTPRAAQMLPQRWGLYHFATSFPLSYQEQMTPCKVKPLCYRIKLTLFIFNWASLQINAETGTISWVDLQQKENKQCLTCAVRYQVSQSSYI